MNRPDPNLTLDYCKRYARDRLHAGAAELLEWHSARGLRNGVIRECANILEAGGVRNGLTLAESLFTEAALEYAANPPKD